MGKLIIPSIEEIKMNPRSRSAKLRIAKRTNFNPGKKLTPDELSVPIIGEY